MSNGLKYTIEFDSNLKEAFSEVNQSIDQTTDGVKNLSKQFKTLVAFETLGAISNTLQGMKAELSNLEAPGAALNHNMAQLSAITGVTGDKLKEIEANARQTAMAFGIDASQQVESYKVLLSKLSPELAKNSTALAAMGNNVAVLSKQMEGDSLAATQVLTTAMNQYGVSLTDPIAASKTMTEMMHIMSKAAAEGSAELPQIKDALEQVGMVAKSTNVSFAETNAAIQVLDKAGKVGAEGGVALRNVLTIIGEGRFMTKASKEGLEAYGISVDALGDKNKSLAERLTILKKVTHDTALMSQVFGRENQAAAIALINGTSEVERYTTAIQGTTDAQRQADIVMGSYQETMARMKAKFDDMKISIFNATQPLLPFAHGLLSSTIAVGQTAQGIYSINQAFNQLKPLVSGLSFAPVITGIKTMWATILSTTSAGATGVSAIIANIPIIGWIAAAIAAIGALTYYLYNNSRQFNEIIGGIWGVIKFLFGGLWDFLKEFFSFLWEGLKAYVDLVQWVGSTIFNAFKIAFEKIKGVAQWLWNGFKSIFGGVADLVHSYIIAPISKAFDWLTDKIKAVLDWFKKAMKPLTDAYNQGAKESGDAYDKRKAEEEGKGADPNNVILPNLPSVPAPNASSITERAIMTADKKKKGHGDGDGSGSGNGVRNLTNNINKLVENITIHTTTLGESKEEIRRFIVETMMTTLNDSNMQMS